MLNKALFTVAGLSTLHVWKKPLINSVILPAHAQTSSPNLPPTARIVEGSAPEFFDIILSDDQPNFEYSIDSFEIEDGLGEVNPPRFIRTISGNSGMDTEVTLDVIVPSISSNEFRITLVDSDGTEVAINLIGSTP